MPDHHGHRRPAGARAEHDHAGGEAAGKRGVRDAAAQHLGRAPGAGPSDPKGSNLHPKTGCLTDTLLESFRFDGVPEMIDLNHKVQALRDGMIKAET